MIYSIILIHLLISLIYFAFCLKYLEIQESIYRFIIVLVLPVFGLIFFILVGIFKKIIKVSDNILESYEKYIKDSDEISYVKGIDFKEEINIIPVTDSLFLSSNKEKRSYLINLLKKDYSSHIKVLRKALVSDDTEISHYAGAAIMEIKKQFESLLKSANEKYENNKDDIEVLREYIDIIKRYLNSGIPDRVDYNEYKITYSYILEKFLLKNPAIKEYFSEKISCDIELGNFESAKEFCKKFSFYFPNDEEPYLMLMKFFYATNNYKSLNKVIDFLKNTKLKLSEKIKNILNYWERFDINVH